MPFDAVMGTGAANDPQNPSDFLQIAAKDVKEVMKWSAAAYVGARLLLTAVNPLIAGAYIGGMQLVRRSVQHITEKTVSNEGLRTVINYIVLIASSIFGITMLGLSGCILKIVVSSLVMYVIGHLLVKGLEAYMAEGDEKRYQQVQTEPERQEADGDQVEKLNSVEEGGMMYPNLKSNKE